MSTVFNANIFGGNAVARSTRVEYQTLSEQALQGAGAVSSSEFKTLPAGAILNCSVTVEEGTATLDLKIQGYNSATSAWVDIVAIPQISAIGDYYCIIPAADYAEYKIVGTVGGGSTPKFTYKAWISY